MRNVAARKAVWWPGRAGWPTSAPRRGRPLRRSRRTPPTGCGPSVMSPARPRLSMIRRRIPPGRLPRGTPSSASCRACRAAMRAAPWRARGTGPRLSRCAGVPGDLCAGAQGHGACAAGGRDLPAPRRALARRRRDVSRPGRRGGRGRDDAEAARAEQASLALQPSNAAASNGLGLTLIEQGNPAGALAAFERAVKDDPGMRPSGPISGTRAATPGKRRRPRRRIAAPSRRTRVRRTRPTAWACSSSRAIARRRRSVVRAGAGRLAGLHRSAAEPRHCLSGDRQSREGDRDVSPGDRRCPGRHEGAPRRHRLAGCANQVVDAGRCGPLAELVVLFVGHRASRCGFPDCA